MDFHQELAFAKNLAQDACQIMLKYFLSDSVGTIQKSDKTLVTKADEEINTLVLERIKERFPDHSVWGEEESHFVVGARFTWVCDPVDGTMPFAKGLPISTFSLALVDSDGDSVLGVIADPYQNRLYEAVKGKGAFLNSNPIHVSEHGVLNGAYIDQELWFNSEEKVTFNDPKDVFNKAGVKVTTMCSAVIMGCLVAEGTFDAMIFGQGKPEDIAALKVIVEEAGGKVTDLFGRTQRYDRNIVGALVSNGKVHDDVIRVLQSANYKSKFLEQ